MEDREQTTKPSFGSNEIGTETNETHLTPEILTGTDTQLHLAAKRGKHKKDKTINDDEKIVQNPGGENKFLQSDETDE
ncbi:MAG: hypothetical protein ACRDE8_07645 [Ginsengibacter sp.]